MDDKDNVELILPREVIEKIASAVRERVQLSGAAIGKVTATGTLTVGATAAVGAMADVIRALPSLAESKKLWESPLGLAIIRVIAAILLALYQENRAEVRQLGSDELTKELMKTIEQSLATHNEKVQPLPESGDDRAEMSDRQPEPSERAQTIAK